MRHISRIAIPFVACLMLVLLTGCSHDDPAKQLVGLKPGTGFMLRESKGTAGTHKYSLFIPRIPYHGYTDRMSVDHARLMLDSDRVGRDVSDNRSDLQDALADCEALLFAPCQADGATLDAAEKSAGGRFAANDLNGAIAARPDLRALRFEQRAAVVESTLHRRSAIPDPTLGVAYTRDYYEAAGNQPYTIGIGASIPLPFFDHGQYQAREADHRAEELAAILQSTQRHAASDARSLLIRRDLLQKKLENIQNAALPRSNEVIGGATTAYARGQISLTDLLIARREHAALELEEADTRFALFSVENELRRALGIDQNLVGEKPREDS